MPATGRGGHVFPVDGAQPDVCGGVARCRQQQILRRMEPDGIDGASVTFVFEQASAGVDAPNASEVVGAGCRNQRLVGRGGHFPNAIGMCSREVLHER